MPERAPNGFSWSASRAGQFDNCQRAYFFHYYLATGAAIDADPARAREAKRLKSLTTVPMWVGATVHDTIEAMLREARSGKPVDVDGAATHMLEQMRRDYTESIDGGRTARGGPSPRRFHEHEYGIEVAREEWKQRVDDAVGMIHAFTELDYIERIRDLDAEEVLALEDLERWDFEGVPVWVKIDLAYREPGGRVHIVDWKTGKMPRGDNPLQMMGYATYAERAWGVRSEDLAVREVYLRQRDPEKWCTVDDAGIEHARRRIRESVGAMLSALPDPAVNRAGEMHFEAFPEPRKCARCFFRGICTACAV